MKDVPKPAPVAGFFMRGRMGGMLRLSVKSALISFTLISCGLALLAPMIRSPSVIRIDGIDVIYWLCGGTLVGAGLFMFVGRPWIGAAIVAGIQLLVVLSRIDLNGISL